jgi:serine/threonine protein kinase
MPLDPNQVLNNRYRIIELLGQGGFGAVYRAWDNIFDLPCAIKENVETAEAVQRQFLREARLLHALRHPNLPMVKDYFIVPGQGQYLVMDFVEGEDLHEMLDKRGGPLPEGQVLAWAVQICDALIYLHAQTPPVIHRDIKPANIKITPEGRAMLVDFGIAKRYDPDLKTTQGARAVTPGYSPPEQYGQSVTDGRSDIYALGATLYNLLSDRTPPDSLDLLIHRAAPPMPLAAVNPAVSPPVSAIVAQAMQMDREQRFASVAEFKAAIRCAPSAIYDPQAEVETKKAVRGPASDATLHSMVEIDKVGIVSHANTASVVVDHQNIPSVVQPQGGEEGAPETARLTEKNATGQGMITVAQQPGDIAQLQGRRGAVLRRWAIWVVGVILVIAFVMALLAAIGRNTTNNGLQTRVVALEKSATALAILPPSATPLPLSPTPMHAVLPSATPSPPPSPTFTETPSPTSSPTPTETSTPTPSGPVIGGADKVAFIDKNEVWVANLDGSDLVQLTDDRTVKSNLQWAPDGQSVNYISGKCVYAALLAEKRAELINCFNFAQYFKAFEISPDGKQVALSIDNQLYIVPYDLGLLRSVSVRESLTKIATCKDYAPYRPFFVKFPRWSRDGSQLASIIMGVASGVGAADTVMVISLEKCTSSSDIIEKFPPPYFMPVEYKTSPTIVNFGWDGYTQFSLATFIRNSGFGKLYTYNSSSHKDTGPLELISECCYRDPIFSPDGSHLLFAYQKYPGGDGNIQLYMALFGTLGLGGSYTPLPLPPIDPKSQPQPALRKVP